MPAASRLQQGNPSMPQGFRETADSQDGKAGTHLPRLLPSERVLLCVMLQVQQY